MTHEEFFEKMTFPGLPFTNEDAAKLEAWGYEIYQERIGKITNETRRDDSRFFACEIIWNEASDCDTFNAAFADVIGRELTQDEFDAVAAQLNWEW